MSGDEIQPLVGGVLTALAEVLDARPAGAWDVQSLCEMWRIRHVVAHVTNAARYTSEEYMAEVAADGGDFGVTGDRLALRDGALDPSVLLANLRDERLHRWTPPGGGPPGALTHAVIHGLDAATPLDVRVWIDPDALRTVLGILTEGGVHAAFGTRIEGVGLRAADLDWSHGDGPVVSAASDDLVMVLSGRRVDPSRILGSLP